MSVHGPRRNVAKERFWRRTLGQQKGSGLSIREFCRRQGLAETAFHAWRREIPRRDQELRQSTAPAKPAKLKRKPPRGSQSPLVGNPRFLPVALTNVAAVRPVEIALPSGVVLRISCDCDRQTLRTVLGALEAPAC